MFEITVQVNGSLRREVRAQMQDNGVAYTENKGLFSSSFTFVTKDRVRAEALREYFKALQG